MNYTVKEILHLEVAPALGCTEPVAIALATAAAASVIKNERPEHIEIWVDPNIYKNGLAVIIPGTGGLNGLDTAAALGALCGDPALGLEVLEPVTDEGVNAAYKFKDENNVAVNLLQDQKGIYVRALLTYKDHVTEAIIEGVHDNITSLTMDSLPITDSPLVKKTQAEKADVFKLEDFIKKLSLDDLIDMINDLDKDDFTFLKEGITYNMRLADYGLKHGSGLGVGLALERLARLKLLTRDMILSARIITSAAADARMGGIKLPAMSSGGSGNHGLTAILPIYAVSKFVDCDEKTLLEAIALSHLVTAYVKAQTGRLSAVCGCSVAAGAGATAGTTYLMGGTSSQMAGAITNLTEDLAGIICDGAKSGCALKLATAAGTAVQAALFAIHGVNVHSTDGIIGTSPEQTMQNIGTLSTQGMIDTDRTILKIMLEKHFATTNI
ncbi:serine dehydratase subunit alpha family protein [Maridesulfovibrio ferrireducens]|uniref:L-cysteine desulfidase family protein n=1 Tax=Maridesulfovibrio ferrireducens TaxID=246191 RepID=UPI001A2899EF|nr:L-serine ammonia-lyase, iron-sulfur-dependent, subunit alpha [Maridesulfovibrio ferrireducens]MBI9109655.1 serine dehydratase subunit alpha family protein [Maridesulfovibrio ferrireducens]